MQTRSSDSLSVNTKAILATLGVGALAVIAYTQVPSVRRFMNSLVSGKSPDHTKTTSTISDTPPAHTKATSTEVLSSMKTVISDIDHVLVPFNLTSEMDDLLRVNAANKMIREINMAKNEQKASLISLYRKELWAMLKEKFAKSDSDSWQGAQSFVLESQLIIMRFLKKESDNKFIVAGKYAAIFKSMLLDDELGYQISLNDREEMVKQQMVFLHASSNPANKAQQIKKLLQDGKFLKPASYQYVDARLWAELEKLECLLHPNFYEQPVTFSWTSMPPDHTPFVGRANAGNNLLFAETPARVPSAVERGEVKTYSAQGKTN